MEDLTMSKYTKFGFTLGQQLTLDGEDVMIVGFEKYDCVVIAKIITKSNSKVISINYNPNDSIHHEILQEAYEAYVTGFGQGGLSINMPEKYKQSNNPHQKPFRLWANWNYGFKAGVKNQLNKVKV